jgi:hypothetical protein
MLANWKTYSYIYTIVSNSFRSTMGEDRFNALLLLYVHKDIEIDISKVVEMYARQYPRRMPKDQTNKMCQSSREICLRKSGVRYA